MRPQTILVTGGAGYIGSHVCKALAADGFRPVVFDNLVRGHREVVRWGPLVEGDICDSKAVARAIEIWQPDVVVHLAAYAYVGESVAAPDIYYQNNCVGMLSLLEACRTTGLDQIVFSSSCATYGVPSVLPIREDAAQWPVNPYGWTKLMGERMLEDYGEAYDLRHVILRYFNACGADPDGELGEAHDPETHLVPRALMAAAGTIECLLVFGDDYATPDGTCIRDYIHVSDLARAHVASVRHLLAGGENLTANIATGRGVSIREILGAIEQVTGRAVPVSVVARRAGDPPALYAECDVARRVLGFEPQFSDLETIIRTAAPFFIEPQPSPQQRPEPALHAMAK